MKALRVMLGVCVMLDAGLISHTCVAISAACLMTAVRVMLPVCLILNTSLILHTRVAM